jgi:hypothetical protein
MDAPILANLWHRLSMLPAVWHVLWGGLAVLSVALIVLSRTRWGQSKPLRKCAVLSLLAHVLLACFATTVKIVTTPELPSARPAVRVAIVSDEVGTTRQEAPAIQIQPWEGLQSGPISRPELPPWERPQHDDPAEQIPILEPFEEDEPQEGWSVPAPEDVAPVEPQLPESAHDPGEAQTPLEPAPVDLPKREVAPPATLQPKLLSAEAFKLERTENDVAPEPILETLEQEWLAEGPPDSATVEEERDLPALADPPMAALQKQPFEHTTDRPLAHAAQAAPISPKSVEVPRPLAELEAAAADEPMRPAATAQVVTEGSSPTEASIDPSATYGHRQADKRVHLVEDHGGSEATETAVSRALQWLARAQSLDGRWDVVRHGGGREYATLGHNRQGAGMQADAGVTGLALLAFLGAGHTHREGAYQENVRRAVDYLLSLQKEDGNLAGPATLYAQMYCHAMAAFALSEAYGMTGDPALREPVRRAVAYTVAAQHTGGGWRYRPGDPGDTSQLGWQLMTLRSAELAGFTVPEASWERAGKFLESVSRGRAGGLAAYQPGTGVSRAMSAEATFCKLLLADRAGRPESLQATCVETAEYLRGELPGMGRTNIYYWYYATLLLHLCQHGSPSAGQDWQVWNEALKDALLASQYSTGPLDGAWGSDTMWGGYGGRVYTTALAALCLETYYRYLPLLNRPANRTVRRPGTPPPQPFDTRDEAGRIE